MCRWQNLVGVVLGLAVGCAVLALRGSPRHLPASTGPILSECDGRLRELVIHYEPAAKEIVAAVYRDFLGALSDDITVHVVCPTADAFQDLRSLVGPTRCRLAPVVVGHAITTWSRDRWVALGPPPGGGVTTVWSPRGEAGEELWPARAGDQRVGSDLAWALGPAVAARRSGLYFDGGDFLADSERVFVVPRVLERNLQHTVSGGAEFLDLLSTQFKRRVVLLEAAPDHHAGMFMVALGNRRMLVGDPGLAQAFIANGQYSGSPAAALWTTLPGGPDFSPGTQRLFDAVAGQCAAAGYTVTRIPTVPARDGRTYLTYVNVLLDQQGPERVVYLPFYRGAEPLNAAARQTWERLGFQVRAVDCTQTFRHFGCLHCLVNVLRRG